MVTKIKKMMIDKGMTNKAISLCLKCSRQKASRIVCGKTRLLLSEAIKIAQFMNCEVKDFYEEEITNE